MNSMLLFVSLIISEITNCTDILSKDLLLNFLVCKWIRSIVFNCFLIILCGFCFVFTDIYKCFENVSTAAFLSYHIFMFCYSAYQTSNIHQAPYALDGILIAS